MAAVWSSGGSTSGSTISGSSVYAGTPGMYDTSRPAVTRISGAGTAVRRAAPATAVLPATRSSSGSTSMAGGPVLPGAGRQTMTGVTEAALTCPS